MIEKQTSPGGNLVLIGGKATAPSPLCHNGIGLHGCGINVVMSQQDAGTYPEYNQWAPGVNYLDWIKNPRQAIKRT